MEVYKSLLSRRLRLLLCFVLLLVASCYVPEAAAQDYQPIDSVYLRQIEQTMDSLERIQKVILEVKRLQDQQMADETQLHYDHLLPLVSGLVRTATNHTFNDRPATFSRFHFDGQDYVPAVTPLAIAWSLKAAGVESRSQLPRMATANALAVGLTVGLGQGLKHTVSERRPDGTDSQSFPSGHTALAFMSATVLHREYGHLSPWISVGAYASATTTELLRVHHNRHYMNDVFVGAGIGVTATHLAYFLTDQIYKGRYINPPGITRADLIRVGQFLDRPTSFSFFSGSEIGSKSFVLPISVDSDDQEVRLHSSSTFSTGVEYRYFFDSNWAAETSFRVTTQKLKTASLFVASPTGKQAVAGAENLYQYHGDLALRFSQPVGLNQRLSFRLLAGDCYTPSTHIRFRPLADATTSVPVGTLTSVPCSHRLECGTGFSLTVFDKDKFATGFNVDYIHVFSHFIPDRLVISSSWCIFL